jgi:hypothetical protein
MGQIEQIPIYAGRPIRIVTGRVRRDAQIDLLVAGIVRGLPVPKAAEAASMATSTAYEVLQDPAVKDRLAQVRSDALKSAAQTAAGLANEAVETLATLMRDSKSDAVRRLAADSILVHASTMAAEAEVQERIAQMAAELDAIMPPRV